MISTVLSFPSCTFYPVTNCVRVHALASVISLKHGQQNRGEGGGGGGGGLGAEALPPNMSCTTATGLKCAAGAKVEYY